MNNIQKRFLLFLFGCISVRTMLVIVAKNNQEYLPIMGNIGLIPAIGFLYIYITDGRKTGAEVFGKNIWWNNIRPVHGLLYILFSIYASKKNPNSWIFLLFDVIIGLISFLYYHNEEGNFSKLF